MTSRYFAVIPAAGHSSRMGQPKLLMPLDGQAVVVHTLAAWRISTVDRVAVVIRPDDVALADVVRAAGASRVDLVIPPLAPPDMKASIQAALRHIDQNHSPAECDAFLVAPADMPRLSPAIIDRIIARHLAAGDKTVLTPTLQGKRGHPVLFPWPLASEVFSLEPAEGLDAIVRRHAPVTVPCEDLVGESEYPFADIDTPEDYREMTQ